MTGETIAGWVLYSAIICALIIWVVVGTLAIIDEVAKRWR